MPSRASYPIRFDHCVIHVSDWERSNRFYSEVLGAELISVNGRTAYRFGTTQLNLHGPGVSAGPLAKLPVQPGNSDLCFAWEGPITAALEHLKSKGVAVELGPVSRAGAQGMGKSVYFRDPDGSLLLGCRCGRLRKSARFKTLLVFAGGRILTPKIVRLQPSNPA